MLKYNILMGVLFVSCWLCSCNSGGGYSNAVKYGSQLSLARGSKYYYNIDNQTTTRFEVNKNKTENKNTVNAGIIYEVMSDSGGHYVVKMVFDKFTVHTKNADGEKDMTTESGQEPTDPAEQMLRRLKGNFVLITLDHKGVVLAVQGYKELADQILGGVNVMNPSDRQAMRQQLMNMFGEGFVKSISNEGLGLLPDSAVFVGGGWSKKINQSAGLNFSILGQYTLSSVENDIASIDVSGQINEKDSGANLFGSVVNLNLTGKEEGRYHADAKTGMLRDGESDIDLKGTVEVQLREVPLDIEIKKEIKVVKI